MRTSFWALLILQLLAGKLCYAESDKTPQSSDTSFFPVWGEEATARGYELPEPVGINVSHMNIRQNVDVDSITFSGLSLGSHPIPVDMFAIDVGNTREHSTTDNIRLDLWVFPFLNVYGLLGNTQGASISTVSVDANPANFSGIDHLIAQSVHRMHQSGELQNIDFKLKFKGMTWGGGVTFAGGYNDWFALVDTNYTRTDFDILDGKISALTVSPRVGYRFHFTGIAGPSHLSLWVGSMYQDVQQEFKGSLADLSMPAVLVPLINSVNQNGQGRFAVNQHLTSPWNLLVGMQYEITQNFNILAEVGFDERNSFFIAGEYRF